MASMKIVIRIGLFIFFLYILAPEPLQIVKPELVVDKWSRLPTNEEWAAAGFEFEYDPAYKPLMKDGLTATTSHLQCPSGFKLKFPNGVWDDAICVK